MYGQITKVTQVSINRTMRILRAEGLVNRLPYFDLNTPRGTMTYVYGLSDKGVLQLSDDTSMPLYHIYKTFDEHSQRTLDHELEVSFFHIALKKFCADENLKLYWQQKDLKCTVNPDAYFAITDPVLPDGKNTFHYFLEIERAKLGHFRNGEPQIMKKLDGYYKYFNSEKCQKEWNFKQFRVIVVQPSAVRSENLLERLAKNHKHRMFWLTTEEAYKAGIGGKIFKTPKDFASTAYSMV